jgi:hypothetical protein
MSDTWGRNCVRRTIPYWDPNISLRPEVLTALMTLELLTMIAKEWAPLTPLSVLPFVIGAILVVVSWVLHWRKMNRDD